MWKVKVLTVPTQNSERNTTTFIQKVKKIRVVSDDLDPMLATEIDESH